MNKLFVVISILLFLSLGNILDLTNEKISKSDLIVVLGGGKKKRIEIGLALYKKGFSASSYILFTGNNKYYIKNMKSFFINNGIEEKKILSINNISNTMEELIEVKKYLKSNNLNSVLFVTHPTHTLRIKLLGEFYSHYKKDKITINFASADHTNVWNKKIYFLELESLELVILETLKIVYNFIKYYF